MRNSGRRIVIASLVAAGLALAPSRLQAQTASELYAQALARETAARAADPPPTLAGLRSIVKAYEAILDRYPSSAYCDNALWQAAGLEALAFDRFADPADEQHAQRLLEWLQQEYPSSSLVKKAAALVAERRATAPHGPDASAAAPSPQAAGAPTGPAVLRAVTRTALPRGDRITIEFTREVAYSGDRIPGPDRVYLDFPNAGMGAAIADRTQAINGLLVKSMRVAAHDARTTRLVLELMGQPRYSVFPLYEPFRLVIDIEADSPLPATAATPPAKPTLVPVPDSSASTPSRVEPDPPPPARETPKPTTIDVSPAPASITSRGDYSLARQLGLGVSRIVIDAGHGGHDPGAQANGIDEAELVLDVALRLEKLLRDQPGFEVALTRRGDEFIALEERTAIANRESADLFLSIHANASREATAHGVETYFLNFATNPAAEAVAARENATSSKTMGNLPEIVKAIAMNNKVAESREVASMVQTSLMRRLSQQNKSLRDLGVKQAPFVVLIGAQMPSVLAEISFVTNRAEASLLKQATYRQRIAQALCDAIVKYRGSLKKVTSSVAAKGKVN